MKVFRLSCSGGHDFDGWFASAGEFDRQQAAGEIRCPLCENRHVTKLPSAPYVNTGARDRASHAVASNTGSRAPELAAAMAALRAHVVANTEDVGRQFPEVARRMHYGEESKRGIRGRVTSEEAGELTEEGIEAVSLPPGLALDGELH
ncbi:MAG TPA: DUF1178 family protein [Usitatibacteraceae bacterium]|nr:DUF1178 family protein [Usitatibacteraceae bacterium]